MRSHWFGQSALVTPLTERTEREVIACNRSTQQWQKGDANLHDGIQSLKAAKCTILGYKTLSQKMKHLSGTLMRLHISYLVIRSKI